MLTQALEGAIDGSEPERILMLIKNTKTTGFQTLSLRTGLFCDDYENLLDEAPYAT